MNRALTFTLVALAVIVALFVATWLTIPAGRVEVKNLTTGQWETKRVGYPARLFRVGLVERERGVGPDCSQSDDPFCRFGRSDRVKDSVDLGSLRSRAKVVYGGLAVIVILIGLAFGAFRRPRSPAATSRRNG